MSRWSSRPEEPPAGEKDHQGQKDGEQQQQGEEHTGDHLPHAPVALAAVDVLHDVHQRPEGRRREEQGHEDPRHQQAGGLVIGDVIDIVQKNAADGGGEQGGGGGYHGLQIHRQQADKGVDADEQREEGEDQKVGQLGGGAGDTLGKIEIHHLQDKLDRPFLQQLLGHGSTSLTKVP